MSICEIDIGIKLEFKSDSISDPNNVSVHVVCHRRLRNIYRNKNTSHLVMLFVKSAPLLSATHYAIHLDRDDEIEHICPFIVSQKMSYQRFFFSHFK